MHCSGPGDVAEGVLSPPRLLDLCICHVSVTSRAGPAAGGEQRVSPLQPVLGVHRNVCAPSVQSGGAVQRHHWVKGWKMPSPKWSGSLAARTWCPVDCCLCMQRQKHISSLATYPQWFMVGFWPLSPSWCRKNGHLGTSHWLNIPPLKAVVQGWAEVSQDQVQRLGWDQFHLQCSLRGCA